jgi:hypothetical protein
MGINGQAKSSIARNIGTGLIFVPGGQPQIKDDYVYWSTDPDSPEFGEKQPSFALANEFAELWKKPNEDIQRFCHRWGPLRINEAGDPLPHVETVKFNEPNEFPPFFGRESLKAWRYFSHRASCVMGLSVDLRQGKMGPLEEWNVISSGDSSKHENFWGFPNHARRKLVFDENGWSFGDTLGLDATRSVIASEVNHWIRRYPFFLNLEWQRPIAPPGDPSAIGQTQDGRWAFQITFGNGRRFLNVIAYQLSLLVAHADLFRCSACGRPYLHDKDRHPKSGQSNYCRTCRTGTYSEAERRADAGRLKKIREARQMHEHGRSLSQIVAKLGLRDRKNSTALERAARWVEKGK